jgi:hypothetical protein
VCVPETRIRRAECEQGETLAAGQLSDSFTFFFFAVDEHRESEQGEYADCDPPSR